MNEAEDESIWAEFLKSGYDGKVGVEVTFDFTRFDVKDVNEHSDVGKYVLPLRREVSFHECILAEKKSYVPVSYQQQKNPSIKYS